MAGGFPAGALVELKGLKNAAHVAGMGPRGEAPDFDGARAQLLEWREAEDQWVAVTFNGFVIGVKPKFCRLLTPDELEGSDLVVGPQADLDTLMPQVANALVEKSFCSMTVILSDEYRAELLNVAKELEAEGMFSRLPRGFEPGYLGKNGKGKVVLIESLTDDAPDLVKNSPLPAQDQNFTVFSQMLQPYMQEAYGFDIYSRTDLMLRMPFVDVEDEAKYVSNAAPAKEADAFLSTMGRKRMAVLHFLGPEEGELRLIPRNSDVPEVILVAKANTLVMFITEHYDYSYTAKGESLVLQTWYLAPPLQFNQLTATGNVEIFQSGKSEEAPPPLDEGATIITGMASRDPCMANTHEEFWTCVRHAGADGFCEIPYERFDVDQYIDYFDQQKALTDGKSYCRHQGQIEGMEFFDAAFYNIPEQEAFGMDPEQRVTMETGWLAMQESGYDAKILKRDGGHVGVFVGNSQSDWRDACQVPSQNGIPETFIANRVSYALNLKGPSTILNTACSASLVAAHSARLHMNYPYDKLEACLVVGISLNTAPGAWVGNCAGNMLSFIGRSFTFNSTADGYGRGEGCAALVLKSGEFSEDENSGIFAALAGSNTNSDGRSASLTAPNGPAQQRLLRAILSESGLESPEIDIYEAHGTGTSLGDPIEVGAVKKVHMPKHRANPIGISCSKTNIGHLEGGAGASGLVKCVMQCMHTEICPNLHLQHQNPHLDTDGFPVMLLNECVPMRSNTAYVGVSGFGFGGTNSHCMTYAKNIATSRGTTQKYIKSSMIRKIKGAAAPEIFMEGESYEDWTTTGMPHLTESTEGKTYHVELLSGNKAVWREVVAPQIPPLLNFAIMGSFNGWSMNDMRSSDEADGLFTYMVTLGAKGEESFQIVCEDDPNNMVIFPDGVNVTRKTKKILGPGPAPSREHAWVIKGEPGSEYRVEFFKPSVETTSILWVRQQEQAAIEGEV